MKILTNQKLQLLQTDGGGEYHSNEFINFCKSQGIHHRRSVPHTPQQNGTTERKNRSLLNAARSMLHAAKLESKFWEEAIATTCYIQNRIYHHSLGFLTPFELWYGHKPHLQNLKVFGCPAFAHISDAKRKKLDPKAKKTVFVGYGDAHGYKAYCLYDPNKNSFFFNRSVLFDEDKILQEHNYPTTSSPITENNQHNQGVVTWWQLHRNEQTSNDMHQGPISIVPTPSTVSFSLTTPSHYPFSDVEYSSTHLGTPSSLSPSPKSFPLHQENSHRIQKLNSRNQSVQNPSSPPGERGEYEGTSAPSILSNHPYISSPQQTIAWDPTSAANYRTTPLDEGAHNSHDFIQRRHGGQHDHLYSSKADTDNQQQEISWPFSSSPYSSHRTPEPLIQVFSRCPS